MPFMGAGDRRGLADQIVVLEVIRAAGSCVGFDRPARSLHMNLPRSSPRIVIVVGASSGIGEASALRLAQEGAIVVLAARREDKGAALAKRIVESGGQAHFRRTDVTKAADVEALVGWTVERFGRLDAAVHSAGVSGPVMKPMAEVEEAEWDAVMDTNLKSVWRCMKAEIPAMLAGGGGAIVNVASLYGVKASDVGHSSYCTSKHALVGLSRSAAVDYGQQGVRVNVVAPGYTHSEMVDPYVAAAPELVAALTARHSGAKRLGEAAETAEAIAWLCSDASRFVNGAVLAVDGGETSRLY